jgi:hypothetical protein
MKSYLDVSILVNEFDTGVKTFQNASDVARDTFKNDVVFHLSLFVLVYNVFKYHSDYCDDSYKESSISKGSKMESESPFNSKANSGFVGLFSHITSMTSEVPHADNSSCDENLNGYDPCNKPEHSKHFE